MDINKIGIEYVNNKLCLVIYNDDLTKEVYYINNKLKDKLFDLLLDITLFSKKNKKKGRCFYESKKFNN